MAWNTITELQALWRDAPANGTASLYLEAAHSACVAYAPALAEGAAVPASYKVAEALQARNIWNSARASASSGEFDNGAYGLTARPLDWQVQQLLRPRRGIGAIV